jgi:hypothetical protein
MPNIAPTELIELDSLFRLLFPCCGKTNSLFGRARELVRNVVKLLGNPTIGTTPWRPNPQVSLIISLFAGKCGLPAPPAGWCDFRDFGDGNAAS